MELVPGRCENCGSRWKAGQPSKKFCSPTCKLEAFWRRKLGAQERRAAERRDGERRKTERRTKKDAA